MGPSWTLGLAAAMVCCLFTVGEGVAGEKEFEPLPLMTGEDAADAHLRLGVDFYLIDELDVAVREFREAVRQRPGFAEAYHNLGVGLARMGDLSGAITAWEQAERLAPDAVSTRYRTAALVAFNFGIARLHEKHLSEALDQWQEAIRWQPNLVEAHYALGYGYLTAGNPLPAVTHFRHALYWAPAWAKAYEGLGQAYYDSHDYGSAREAWLRAGELDPLEPRVSANLGLLSLQEGNFQLAIDYSRQALEREPTLASAHFNLGLALFRTGEDEASLKSFQNAWSLDPSLTSALLVMGIVKSRQGEWASAASLWRTALQKSPADSERMWLHFNYGVALHMMGETQGAIREFHQVLQEQPDWAPGWMQLGQTFMGLHQWGQAAHAFEQAAALSPRSASLYYALGQARLQQHRFEEAGQAFRQAVKLEPTFWEGQYQLGVLLRARNRLGEAVEPLRRAAEGGFRQAQGLLASMYANGSGVDRNLPLAMLWWFRLGSAEDEVDRVSGGQELSRLRGDLHGQRLSVAERQAVLAGFDVIRQELMSSDARPVFSTVLMNGAPHWQSLQPSVPVLSWVIQLALALDGPAQDTLARWYEEGAFREVGQAHQRIEAYFLQAGKEGNPHSCQIIQRVAQKESAGERGADSSAGWGAAWRGCRIASPSLQFTHKRP